MIGDYYQAGFQVMGSYIQPRHRDLFVFFEDEEPFPDKLERAYIVDKYNRPDLEVAVYKNSYDALDDRVVYVPDKVFYVFNDGTPNGPVVLGRDLERTYKLAKLTFATTNY